MESHSLSLSAEREVAELDLGLGYTYSYTRLNRESFLSTHSIAPSLGFVPADGWYAYLRHNLDAKRFLDDRDRDAVQNGLEATGYYFFNENRTYVSFGYRIENEDTGGPEFDYLGHYARARLRTPIFESELQPKLTLAYEYFEKDYRNITAAIGVKRKDSRQTASAELSVRIAERWTGSASYEYISASSNLSSSDFEERIATANVSYDF